MADEKELTLRKDCVTMIEKTYRPVIKMRLSSLLARVRYRVIQGTTDREVKSVTNDTKAVQKDDVYICIEGYEQDGHRFAWEASERGAAAVVVSKMVVCPEDVTVIQVADPRCVMAEMSAASFGYPAEKLDIIGVTGTKGKTTTAWMIREILRKAGRRPGLIGTIETDTGLRRFPSIHTTPESCDLQRFLKEMIDAGCDTAVMEVSSQALKLQRTSGVFFKYGVFTNLGRDHIGPGEHADMEEYLQCKHLLFLQCETGVGNADDPAWEEVTDRCGCRKVTFGMKEGADYRAIGSKSSVRGGRPGMCFILEGRSGEIFLPLPGQFNVQNALAASAALLDYGIPMETVASAMRELYVPGRMEQIPSPEGCSIFLDYAHNAMSLSEALGTLRKYAPGRLVVVFGCGGGRSKERRYEMGETAGRLADHTIITSDNPRWENPEDIIADIVSGIRRTKGDYTVIQDRRQAVHYALKTRHYGDIILIAGKGHETYQEIRGIRYPMDDRELISRCMAEDPLSL